MIRPFTIVCMLMAVGSGLYLYQCKHQAQVLDRQIARTIRQTDEARDRIGMLRAEWAQLNAPDHIAELAHEHTTLQTAKPTQFITVNELAAKLPPPPQPADHPDAPAAAPPVAQAQPSAAPVAQPAPAPQVATAAPQDAAKPHAAEVRAVATADPKPAHRPGRPEIARAAPARLASARDVTRRPSHDAASFAVNADAIAPGTVGAAVLRAMRARQAAGTRAYVEPVATREPAYAPPRYAAPAYAVTGSMLGGTRSNLPPPVPFAAR